MPQNKLLIIGYVWPEPKTTAAGHRMLQLIHEFVRRAFKITFVTTASKTQYSEDLEKLGVQTGSIELNNISFDVFIQESKPDVVIFDRFMVEEQFGWRVADHAPNAVRILNTEDLHSLRKTREICHKKGTEFTVAQWLENNLTKREIASIYRSDLSLLVSNFEMQLLKNEIHIADNLMCYLPFLLDTITLEKEAQWPSFKERKDFICFGNGKHAPNIDAIEFLIEELWPQIHKQLPDAKLHIYGAYLPQQVLEMQNPKQGFLVHGWVADLDKALQSARINLAPLRFGAGIKGKLTAAMQNGTPSITTPIGVEGMHGNLPWAGTLVENPIDFIHQAVQLYKNEEEWLSKQQNGIPIVNELYAKDVLAPSFFKILDKLQPNIIEHRAKNFIGSLLQHYTMASTKFMSKWIEEKNKKK